MTLTRHWIARTASSNTLSSISSAAENPLPKFRRVSSEEKSTQGLNRLKIAWSPGSDQPGVGLL
jgi:hypothetical protein